MMTKDEILAAILEALAREISLPHQASTVGYYLFLLLHVHNARGNPDVEGIRLRFLQSLPQWRFEGLLQHQIDYARRIADSEGNLEYEDMFKLMTLCDEVHGLEELGLNVPLEKKAEFEKSVKRRFESNRDAARFVAEDLVEDWKNDLWWYRENLVN